MSTTKLEKLEVNIVSRDRATLCAWVVAALLPIWLAGMFGRVYWKPDEPREANIAWHMSQTGPQAVPQLAGQPFMEKPPLLYWLAGAAIAQGGAGGAAPWLARLPNLLYACAFAVALALLARGSITSRGALVASLAGSSFALMLSVAIWLATDAPLVACVALSLLGMYRGYSATTTADRLVGYTIMHVALALAFLAKNVTAWLVPAVAFVTLIIWEKRYRELLRWELYAGLVFEVAIVGSWLFAVYREPQGPELLKGSLWYNVAGRFVHLQGANLPRYSEGHRNWIGKYLVEAPLYVFPWTLLAVAAVREAWRALRGGTAGDLISQRAWRFSIAIFVPSIALLSLSATARGIYAAPSLIGVALAIGLWSERALSAPDDFDLKMLRGSSFLIAALAVLLLLVTPLAVVFYDSTSRGLGALVIGALLIAGAGIWCVSSVRKSLRRRDARGAVVPLYVSYAAILIGAVIAYFPALNMQQDLRPIAAAVKQDLGDRKLMLLAPDETTVAFIDMAGIPATPLAAETSAGIVEPNVLVLANAPGAVGPITAFMQQYGFTQRARRKWAIGEEFAKRHNLRVAHEYATPDGRRYWLLSRADADAGSQR